MNDEQPTQPLTDAELEAIRDTYAKSQKVVSGIVGDPTGPYAKDCGGNAIRHVGHLLAEVDRLRAALTALARNERAAANRSLELQEENDHLRKQVQDYHQSADAHLAKFERQHERLMETKQEVRELRSLVHPQDPAPCARLHDTDPKSAHVVLNTVPMCFLSNEHEANHRCLCGKEW